MNLFKGINKNLEMFAQMNMNNNNNNNIKEEKLKTQLYHCTYSD
jgi:hypothetical protein